MKYGEQDNERQIELKLGQELEITLPEVRTAGYRWTLKDAAAPACALENEDFRKPGAVGGSGTHTWRLKAVSLGSGMVQLWYGREWESSGPSKTFHLKVKVQP